MFMMIITSGPHLILQAAIFVAHSMVVAIRCVNAFALIHVDKVMININTKPISSTTRITNHLQSYETNNNNNNMLEEDDDVASTNLLRYNGKYKLEIVESTDTGLVPLPKESRYILSVSVQDTTTTMVAATPEEEKKELMKLEDEKPSYRSNKFPLGRRLWNRIWFRSGGGNDDLDLVPADDNANEKGVLPLMTTKRSRYLFNTNLSVGNSLRGQFAVQELVVEESSSTEGCTNSLVCCQIQPAGKFGSTLMLPPEEVLVVENEATKILATLTTAELLGDDKELILSGYQGALYFQRLTEEEEEEQE